MKKHKWLKIFAIIISILIIWICASIYLEESNKQDSINEFKQGLVDSTKTYNFIDSIIAEPREWDNPYQLLIKGKSSFDEMSSDEKVLKLIEISKIYKDKLFIYICEQPGYKKMDDKSKSDYGISFKYEGRTEITVETGKGKYIFGGYDSIILPDKTVYNYIPPVSDREYKLALIAEYIDKELTNQEYEAGLRKMLSSKSNSIKTYAVLTKIAIEQSVLKEAKRKFNALDGDISYAWPDYSNKYNEIISRWKKEHPNSIQLDTNNILETKPAITSDYILNDSDKKKLQYSDIEKLNIDQLNLAKNEIYARHGYTFSNTDIANFFIAKKWYQPTNANNSNIVLSEIEKANVNYLQKMVEILVSKKNGYG